jgi:hypothetical protein
MADTTDPRDDLIALASEYRHVRAEHTRASPEGSTRRRLEADMKAVADRFERRLDELGLGDQERAAWLSHAHHGTAAPEGPAPPSAATGTPSQEPPDRPSGRRPWPR